MKKTTDKTETTNISEKAQEETRKAVEKVFGGLAEHIKRIVDDFEEFDKQREIMRRRIQNGARRTKGRVV